MFYVILQIKEFIMKEILKKNNNTKHIYLVSLLFLLLSSCMINQAAQDQEFKNTMDAWIGKTKNSLLLKWGSPNQVNSDGDGGEIITFIETRRGYLPNFGYVTMDHKYMFYINSRNVIYHWNYDRQGRQGH
jgi:hypothetical protein